MPIFEYECLECGSQEERLVLTKYGEIDPVCCGRTMTQLISAPSIRFKGSGFYVNDYGRKKDEEISVPTTEI